jgi:oligopeptide transport system ATP-binding protein
MSGEPILRVRNLAMHFPIHGGFWGQQTGAIRAVDGVDLELIEGETLGLVGESGCGKSTLGRALMQLYRPTRGSVELRESGGAWVDLCKMSPAELHRHRRDIQMIFQDPFASLNPRMTVRDIIAEPIRVHGLRPSGEVEARVRELMEICGLNPRFLRRYPHEFSGGQRQRIGIARALAAEPRILVCDEPISALDVSIQAQILNLLGRLQSELGLTMLFIAHDLAAVRHISNRIAVMYLGGVVEQGDARDLMTQPSHPYTRALLSAVPVPDPISERTRERIVLVGELPSPANPPPGCRFHTRCPWAEAECSRTIPELRQASATQAACLRLESLPPRIVGNVAQPQ